MPIAVVCPGCSARLNAPDAAAGKRVRCPKCQTPTPVPAAAGGSFEVVDDAPPPLPRREPPRRPADEPPPRRRPARIEVDDEDEDDRPRRRPARIEVDDEDEDDRPRRKRRPAKAPPSAARNLVLGGVLLVVVGVSGFVLYDLFGKGQPGEVIPLKEDPSAAKAQTPTTPRPGGGPVSPPRLITSVATLPPGSDGEMSIGCVSISADGKRVALGTRQLVARNAAKRTSELVSYVWDLDGPRKLDEFPNLTNGEWLALTPDGRSVVAEMSVRPVGEVVAGRRIGDGQGRQFALSAAGDRLAVVKFAGEKSSDFEVWEVTTGKRLFAAAGAGNEWMAVSNFFAGGRKIATRDPQGRIVVWDVATGTPGPPATVADPNPDASCRLAVSEDGRYAAAAYLTAVNPYSGARPSVELMVRDLNTGKVAYSQVDRRVSDGQVVAFFPDGKTLAVPQREGTIDLVDVAESRTVATLKGHPLDVTALAVAADGKRLVSASFGGGGIKAEVRVWDLP